MNYSKYIYIFVFFPIFIVLSCHPAQAFKREYKITGKTMGTFYCVKFISSKKEDLKTWKLRIDTRLKEINKRLSMYDPKSELSRFNRETKDRPIRISRDFHTILLQARRLNKITDGAWDGTIKPIVDLWGFGTKQNKNTIPDSLLISQALSSIGFTHIQINKDPIVAKTADVTLDLGSIAKGYGTDAVLALFINTKINNVLVEIGGELAASGKNKKGRFWTVGISRPDKGFANKQLYKIIQLDHQAIATSGNYRNFFEVNGKTFSHIINPVTGFPVDNQIVIVFTSAV
ncbi:MAG: FAD:protein FMN transferase [Desulfobacula sp.]|nr:FAD:protein FMN transferase [Desulfobacula sp.]